METLQQKIQNFVDLQAKYVEKDGSTKFSTCSDRRWDQDIHNQLGAITTALRERGYNVKVETNWGVQDVFITKRVQVS